MESKRGNRNRFQTLAPEIISEILSRLPIESILRCKSVCKTWYALIKDNYFVKLQLSRSNDQASSRVILEPMEDFIHPAVGRLYLLYNEEGKSREIPGFPLAGVNSYSDVVIVCFLDGLICVAPEKSLNPVVIYNPLIRGDYIVLPEIEVGKVYIDFHRIGLGFDPSINKYKAVRMLIYSVNSYYYSLCEVITIREESSWRRVVAPYVGLLEPWCRGGVFHQGSIYWIIDRFRVFKGKSSSSTRRTSTSSREFILEFDVTKEVFRAVSFPPSMRAPKYRANREFMTFNLQLQVLEGGTLALMEYNGQLLHIWRLVKQNGTRVAGYSSIRIELPYKNAQIRSIFLCPTGKEKDLLLIEIDGGFKPGRRRKGMRTKTRKEPRLFYYTILFLRLLLGRMIGIYVNLSSLHISCSYFFPWCFKPSLMSITRHL